MEIVGALRILRRHWVLIVPGLVIAVLAALSVTYRVSLTPPGLSSRDQTGGVAVARVLVAANDDPTVDLGSRITETLPSRASLVSNLVATDAGTTRVARRAGVEKRQIVIIGPAWEAPPVSVPMSTEATSAGGLAREPYVVRLRSGEDVPIISIQASGPDAAGAARVAVAVRSTLGTVVEDRSGRRPAVRLESLGPVVARPVVSSPRKAVAAVAALIVVALWCVALVLLVGVGRRVREAAADRMPPGQHGAGSGDPHSMDHALRARG